jgi:hypothetical protein
VIERSSRDSPALLPATRQLVSAGAAGEPATVLDLLAQAEDVFLGQLGVRPGGALLVWSTWSEGVTGMVVPLAPP